MSQAAGLMEEWEVVSETSQGDTTADEDAGHDGLVELFLAADDCSIQPASHALAAFHPAGNLLSASSEASFEAADCIWSPSSSAEGAADACAAGAAAHCGPSLPGEPAGPSTPRSAAMLPGLGLGADAGREAPGAEAAALACTAPSISAASEGGSVASVKLKLVRVDEHNAMQAALKAMERRTGQRERQLAVARARLAAAEDDLARSDRECGLLRRVALLACSVCAMVGLRAMLGPGSRPLPADRLRKSKAMPSGLAGLKDASLLTPHIYNLYGPTIQVHPSALPLSRAVKAAYSACGACTAHTEQPEVVVEIERLAPGTP